VAVRLLVVALVVALLAACGDEDETARPEAAATTQSEPSDPEAVLRAWQQAVNEDDNVRAASYFAPNAVEINPEGERTPIPHQATALALNRNFGCSGRIQSVSTKGETTSAVVKLDKRRSNPFACGPDVGRRLPVTVTVRNGKIARLKLGP
jgi:hypothetical protein